MLLTRTCLSVIDRCRRRLASVPPTGRPVAPDSGVSALALVTPVTPHRSPAANLTSTFGGATTATGHRWVQSDHRCPLGLGDDEAASAHRSLSFCL